MPPFSFGRGLVEREVTEALVRAADAGCAFPLTTGASGSGKSSLTKAGVLPNLTAPGVAAGVESWRHVLFRPGQAPSELWVLTNAAHAAMFLGTIEASLERHRRYRAAKVNDAQTWVEAVRDGFAEFRKAGLSNPAMAECRLGGESRIRPAIAQKG
ncbi:hypothetical protein A6A40_24495 (plasmid) [Azospirillum humicireducens]|uniref:Novel STAND NTPase 1 domain-containing protein n=1 Tax=Azospirillum humicireducens TaxID=1226968 RepID=A0A2R4VUR4_9PROT|nr:hypothetical protein [Azospirillum humicireducens]AWB08188.1 hypothetical protein A6A40_24495 [Azospirillum humicireducens]